MTSTTRRRRGAEDSERAGEGSQARTGRAEGKKRDLDRVHVAELSAPDSIRPRRTTVDRQWFWRTEPGRAGPDQMSQPPSDHLSERIVP
jgi:hypothetical protein